MIMRCRQCIPARLDQYVNHDPQLIFEARLVFKARPLLVQLRQTPSLYSRPGLYLRPGLYSRKYGKFSNTGFDCQPNKMRHISTASSNILITKRGEMETSRDRVGPKIRARSKTNTRRRRRDGQMRQLRQRHPCCGSTCSYPCRSTDSC